VDVGDISDMVASLEGIVKERDRLLAAFEQIERILSRIQ
jgi:hypothetical protein